MSKTDNKILFLDEDGSEIEFRVIEQTTIAGHTYLLVEDCEASSEDESVVCSIGRKSTRLNSSHT